MTRQIKADNQQMPVFEPLLRIGSPSPTTLLTSFRSTHKSIAPLYDGLISELSVTGRPQQCLQLIAPILRELSQGQNDRWLTLISPPKQMTAQWLRDIGLNRERILVLQSTGMQSSQELACDALSLGCSHTVVSWFNPLSLSAKDKLLTAAHKGATKILNILQPSAL